MLDHMGNCFQDGNIVALRRDAFGQASGRHATDDASSFGDPGRDQLPQLGDRFPAARVEFGVALAMIRQSSYARPNPLAHVPSKMQHQIADGVLVFRVTCPDLLWRQPLKTILDAAVQLIQLLGRKLEENLFRVYRTSSDQFSRIDFTLAVN